MAERDWAKELAKIDKQIEKMSDDDEHAPRDIARASEPRVRPPAPAPAPESRKSVPAPTAGGAPAGKSGKPDKPVKPARTPKEPRETGGFGVFARLALSVAIGIAILVWPYEARCGWGLAAYLAAVTVVAVSGGWSAIWTWRHRAARAHVLSLLILLWGLVLGSMEVLPRVGYAKPDLRHPAGWVCK